MACLPAKRASIQLNVEFASTRATVACSPPCTILYVIALPNVHARRAKSRTTLGATIVSFDPLYISVGTFQDDLADRGGALDAAVRLDQVGGIDRLQRFGGRGTNAPFIHQFGHRV